MRAVWRQARSPRAGPQPSPLRPGPCDGRGAAHARGLRCIGVELARAHHPHARAGQGRTKVSGWAAECARRRRDFDRGHLLVVQLEVEDLEVLRDALGVTDLVSPRCDLEVPSGATPAPGCWFVCLAIAVTSGGRREPALASWLHASVTTPRSPVGAAQPRSAGGVVAIRPGVHGRGHAGLLDQALQVRGLEVETPIERTSPCS